MAESNERIETSVPNLDDNVQICSFCGLFCPSKMKEKLGEVLPSCFLSQDDSIEPQEELDKMLAPFREYCGLELNAQEERLHQINEQLGKILNDDKKKYESMHKENQRQFRKEWRDRRIKIYDYLLRLALLHDPNESNDLWIEGQKSTDFFYVEATKKLEPKRFYTYLVDQVHEDEEIMFKYYCVDKGMEKPFEWQNNAPWLVGSIHVYCNNVTSIVLDALRPWKDGDQLLCDALVIGAKKKFEEQLSSLHGRCFKTGRNWRNRVRFYYLLGLSRHTGIFNEHAGKFKGYEYEGPFSRLVHEMIVEDEDLFDQENKGQGLPLVCKTKYKKQKNGSSLGHLKVDRLLAWASAANDLGFVKILLKYYLDRVNSHANFDFMWEKSVGESWAMALWNASYKGYDRIVKELLSWETSYHLYYSEYFSKKTIKLLQEQSPELLHESPLHIAVLRKYALVVDAFCTTASPHLNCNEKNSYGLTPLEIATKLKVRDDEDLTTKRKIQNLLLQRQEVKDAVAEANGQRRLAVDSSNAVMVGGTLIAGITFAGWLQPPLGYNLYYQFVDPLATAAPPDSYESYMSIQGHITIQLFAIFNSLSFYFAIASVIAGMETFGAIQAVEDTYMVKTMEKLRRKLAWATSLFLASVVCILVAFSCAGIAILPPIKKYQKNMYITTAIGGFICVIFICKMVWYTLPKYFRNEVKWKLHPIFDKWKLKLFPQPAN